MKCIKSNSWLQAIMLLCIMTLAGCSGNNSADISDLLSTVPNDASAVVAFNVRSILEKAGCKIDGSEVSLSPDIKEYLKGVDPKDIKHLYTGEYGADPSAAILFVEGHNVYLTGYLADPGRFRKAVELHTGASFEGSPVEVCANYAYKAQQFWVCLSHKNNIEESEVSRFVNLGDRLSFKADVYGPEISTLDHDIKGWSNIVGIFNTAGLDFQTRSMIRMGMESLFSDAEDIAFYGDFDKGKFSAVTRILNSKGTPAKFLLPADKIDMAAVEKAGTSASTIMAVALPNKLIKEITDQIGNKGISILGAIMPMLQCIDGTVVAQFDGNSNIQGLISTTGEGTAGLSDLLSSELGMSVTKDGKSLLFNNGTTTGPVVNKDVASLFKGATIGMITAPGSNAGVGNDIPVSNIAIMVESAQGSMQLRLDAIGSDPKENILVSMIKDAAAKK